MDERTLKEFNDGKYLEGIYYMRPSIKGLSLWDSCNLFVETFALSDTHYDEVKSKFENENYTKGEIVEELVNSLWEFNMKLMEALGIWVDILDSMEITSQDIVSYYKTLMKERNLYEAYNFDDGLRFSFIYGRHTNAYDERISGRGGFNIVPANEVKNDYRRGFAGRIIDRERVMVYEQNIWQMVKSVYDFVNHFHKSGSQISSIREKAMIVWLYIFKIFDLLDLEADACYHYFYTFYQNKNEKGR
jgi:hypothetical protein